MIDFAWTKLSLGLAFVFFIAFLLYVIIFYGKYACYPNWKKEKGDIVLFVFSLILIIVVSSGDVSDWFSYQQIVRNYDLTVPENNYGEPIYGYIVKFVHKNYLFFRIIVWGGAFLLSCWTFKRFVINVNVAVFVLVSAFLLKFNYARATLGMASYFLGISFLIKPIHKRMFISIMLAGLLLYGAYEFHHSLLPILLLTIVAFIPIEKSHLLLVMAFLVPVVASFISDKIGIVDLLENEYISSKLEVYSEKVAESENILGVIVKVFNYGAFVIPIIMTTVSIIKHKMTLEIPIIRLYRVMICVVLFSTSFLFMGFQSELFTYRYLNFAFIPLIIISVYIYQNRIIHRFGFFVIIFFGILSNIVALFTNLYHYI